MEQPKRLLVAILISSLVTNVILLSMTGASLVMVYKLNRQVEEVRGRVDEVREVVDKLRAVKDTVKEKVQERRSDAGDSEAAVIGFQRALDLSPADVVGNPPRTGGLPVAMFPVDRGHFQ